MLNFKYIPENFFLVGGSVRDYILNKKIQDLDFVVKTSKEKFSQEVEKFCKINFKKKPFLIGKEFPPTFRLTLSPNKFIDITLMINNFREDALRRDFKINAIYLDFKNKEIIDPLNGKKDILEKKIDLTSPLSFQNDPLRMLRAIRLSGQLNFFLTKNTFKKIVQEKDLIKKVAGERIREEIEKIFLLKNSFKFLKILEKTGLLFSIFPELLKIKKLEQNNRIHKYDVLEHSIQIFKYLSDLSSEEKIILSYVALFHDIGKSVTMLKHQEYSAKIAKDILQRLKLPNKKQKLIIDIIKEHMLILILSLNNPKEKTLFKIVYNYSNILLYLIKFSKAENNTKLKQDKNINKICLKLKDILKIFEKKRDFIFHVITGNDLKKEGIQEGKIFGEILDEIRLAIFISRVEIEEEAKLIAKKIIKNYKSINE